MSIELPVLRLGLAGFSAGQKAELDAMLHNASPGGHQWQVGRFADADAWWVNGSRVQLLPDGNVRIGAGTPTDRSLQLDLAQVDRPIAFTLPLASRKFEPAYTFESDSLASVHGLLKKFEGWLQPVAAQFALAARILEQESVLGSGIYHVTSNGALIAVVNMKGDLGVLPSAGPTDFDAAMWIRRPSAATDVPESFVRTTLSQLMWQYALRTTRDVLPGRYRNTPIYFRRPPRISQRLITDAHLLVVRELATAPGTFEELQQRTGLGAPQLARNLSALYLVGSITSNPKRASGTRTGEDTDSSHSLQHSVTPSGMDSEPPTSRPGRQPAFADLTAPAPMNLR
ncbi:MAG: hypothetical protein HYX47_09650 [Burkholderiales bacterium]|nr:hypothetical protein [Burkholderiales bacterium]